MKLSLLFLFALPVGAQISGPQLGVVTHRSELRRIDGLRGSSRLSEPLQGLPGCTRIEAAPGGRWALCNTADAALLIDLQTRSTLPIPAFELVVWSPSGTAVAVDNRVSVLPGSSRIESGGTVVAVSDSGSTVVRDREGTLLFHGEVIAEATAMAFDGEVLLVGMQDSVARIDTGRSLQRFALGFEPAFVAADANAMYAANGRTLARIDRLSGVIEMFELPVSDASITRLDRLADGSLLLAKPDVGEPGWLFHGSSGKFSFIPGIAVDVEVAQ